MRQLSRSLCALQLSHRGQELLGGVLPAIINTHPLSEQLEEGMVCLWTDAANIS
jgi:hypothetical protein